MKNLELVSTEDLKILGRNEDNFRNILNTMIGGGIGQINAVIAAQYIDALKDLPAPVLVTIGGMSLLIGGVIGTMKPTSMNKYQRELLKRQ